jgi:hypothetical protein
MYFYYSSVLGDRATIGHRRVMHASTQLIWNNFESDRRQSDAIETCILRALKRPISSGGEQQQLPVSSTGNGVQLPTRVDRLTTRRSRPQ